MAKDVVVLVHGADSKGEWYRIVTAILCPHFECKPMRYIDYEDHGKFKVLFDRRIFWVAVILVMLALATGFVWKISYAIVGFTAALMMFFCASLSAKNARIQTALGSFTDAFYEATAAKRVHLIAHSFGTILSGLALTEGDAIRAERMILAGSVLPRHFPWNKHHPHKFVHIWNDTASRDFIGWLIFCFRPLTPGLGDSGRVGFNDSEFVHTLEHAWAECSRCGSSAGIVHNVPHGCFHSSALKRGHVEKFWLPFLLAIPTNEYDQFLQWSTELDALPPHADRFRELARIFSEHPWTWVGTTPRKEHIISYLERLIESRLSSRPGARAVPGPTKRRLRQLACLAVARMWPLVAKGRAAQAKIFDIHQETNTPIYPKLEADARMTNPKHAAQAAAKWAVGQP